MGNLGPGNVGITSGLYALRSAELHCPYMHFHVQQLRPIWYNH